MTPASPPTHYTSYKGGRWVIWVGGGLPESFYDLRDEYYVSFKSRSVYSLSWRETAINPEGDSVPLARWDCVSGWTKGP